MTVIDLTHMISPMMPVYPGTECPTFTPVSTYEKDHFRETLLSMYSHTGTHMDAPAHIFPGRTTLDSLPISQFAGKATVIDCTTLGAGETITMDHVRRNPFVEEAEFLLFHTGWAHHWGTDGYFCDYPCVSAEIVDYLLSAGKKGIGLDTISLDPMGSLTLHRRLLRHHEIVIIENLAHLEKLPAGLFTLCALPLRYENADGSPIRAVALLET